MNAISRLISRLIPKRQTVQESGGYINDYPGSGRTGLFGLTQTAIVDLIVDRMERKYGGNTQERYSQERLVFIARDLEKWNPFAQGILGGLKNYTFGSSGMKVSCTTKPGRDPKYAAIAMDYLERFMDTEDWSGGRDSREIETYTRAHRDGEALLRYWVEDDLVRVGYIETEALTPKDGTEVWTFGAQHQLGNTERIISYHTIWGEEIYARDVYHLKCNVDRCIKRGISDFASTAEYLINAYKTYSNWSQSEAVRQSYTYITQHAEGVSAREVDEMLSGQAQYTTQSTAVRALADNIKLQFRDGVGVEHISSGQALAAVPSAENIAGMVQGANACLLAAGVRYHMPLWLIAGDMSQNNVVDLGDESGFSTCIRAEQAWFGKHERNMLWRVLEVACDEGILPDAVLDSVEVCVKPQQSPPRDPKAATDRNQLLYLAGRLSGKSWDAAEGLDTKVQQEEIAKEPNHPINEPEPTPEPEPEPEPAPEPEKPVPVPVPEPTPPPAPEPVREQVEQAFETVLRVRRNDS